MRVEAVFEVWHDGEWEGTSIRHLRPRAGNSGPPKALRRRRSGQEPEARVAWTK